MRIVDVLIGQTFVKPALDEADEERELISEANTLMSVAL
jgi:hypothetical protein